ncbi:hypothetical protein [Pseudoalteromonas aurantia]|uniref:Coil containing protein n=1 Tax=Pseudoalteromonas aurantia 208 TaxID=1314867 RepID=A0ABR9EE68_9GAMM|nr:hypothetical protein [Pseudoalteromonas aurantia]MBE0369234.1 hypothetical protein [Pseudoalteromonas aurantia 208]
MVNISESELLTAIQSAESGAFFRDEIPATNAEESIMWLEHIESQYKRKPTREAAAQGAEKARLVIRRKSQTREILKPETSNAESLRHEKATKLGSMFTGAALKLSPEKRAEYLGISENECVDLETGEVRQKFVSEVDKNHFVSPVYSLSCTHDKALPSNKKPKIVKANYQTTRTHFQSRNWCGGFRVVCTQMTRPSDAPESNTGDRVTTELTSRARGKIIESGLYMAAVKGGFTAFTTVTLDEKARWRMDNNHYRKVAKRKAGVKLGAIYTETGELLHDEVITSADFTAVVFERSTIGQELSPFLDNVGKMHKRGWVATGKISYTPKAKKYPWGKIECVGLSDRLYPWGKVSSVGAIGRVHSDLMHNNERIYPWGVVECIEQCEARAITNDDMEVTKIECEQDKNKKPVFDYVWVAEAPSKIHETREYPWGKVESVGHQNYHAHLLIRWNVEEVFFHEWAARIEKHWGQGFVHIERIRTAEAAAEYLLKAVGYMTKSDQGEIRGNRYNISKYARAEKWENCATHESQHMYGIIQEHIEGLEAKRKRKAKAEQHLKTTIAFNERISAVNKKKPTRKREQLIEKLKQQLHSMTENVKNLADELHGNYAIGGVAKFSNAVEFKKFLDFAIGVRGWKLKTVFSNECDQQYISEQRRDENKVNDYLVKAQTMVNDSIDQVANFYSRYEPVDEYF